MVELENQKIDLGNVLRKNYTWYVDNLVGVFEGGAL